MDNDKEIERLRALLQALTADRLRLRERIDDLSALAERQAEELAVLRPAVRRRAA
jgi:hypothetical protein